jgi:ribulose bisphosphate carboxylase small subunit
MFLFKFQSLRNEHFKKYKRCVQVASCNNRRITNFIVSRMGENSQMVKLKEYSKLKDCTTAINAELIESFSLT